MSGLIRQIPFLIMKVNPLKPTILVVSPNDQSLKIVCLCFEQAGYQVLTAGLAQSALGLIHDFRPILAILDWELPDLSSLAVIRSLRADERTRKLPILLWGPNMAQEDLIRALEAGADNCLKEPFHPQVWIARVHALLRRCYGGERVF